jgi:glutaconate CoA-transferase subunit A
VKAIETSYIGLERFGFAMNCRRALQNGEISIEHYPELIAIDRFRADAEGLSFWPISYLHGTDIVNKNPKIKTFTDPYTGQPIVAVPAAKPDVLIMHMATGDKYGNLQVQENYQLPQGIDVCCSHATKNIIATVEKIVDNETIVETYKRTAIASFHVLSVTEAPFGSHPTPTLDHTRTDEAFFGEYVEASQTKESYANWLDKYIYGTKDFAEYLELVGRSHLNGLKEA